MTYQVGNKITTSYIEDFQNCDYTRYEKSTNSKTREEAFAKWIKLKVEHNQEYIEAKQKCSLAAAQNIISMLSHFKGTSPASLMRFFRIENQEYYYAKTTLNYIEIYRIPPANEFQNEVRIKNLEYKIPQHQLNIHTTIENVDTKKIIEIRSELRYSHGQFNGTPEAKCYVASGDMTALYKKLYPKDSNYF